MMFINLNDIAFKQSWLLTDYQNWSIKFTGTCWVDRKENVTKIKNYQKFIAIYKMGKWSITFHVILKLKTTNFTNAKVNFNKWCRYL